MSASGYATWSVTAGEVPTTAKWNILGANDAAFNTGNGFNDQILMARHFAAAQIPSSALNITVNTEPNGWKMYDFGTFKEFSITKTGTLTAGAGAVGFTTALQTLLPAGYTASQLSLTSASWGNQNTASLRINLESTSFDSGPAIGGNFVYYVNGGAQSSTPMWAIYRVRTV